MTTIGELQERVKQLERDKKSLMNRCWVHTYGAMCSFCCFKEDCDHSKPKEEEPKRKVSRDRSNIFKGR